MKKNLIILSCCICFLLAAANAHAQNSEAPVAKIAPEETALKPDPNNLTTSKIPEPSKPPAIPLQKSETSQKVTPVEQPKANMPGLGNPAFSNNAPKALVPQNMDKPKPSTIQVSKTTEPAKPAPKILDPIKQEL
jgi:hypothetical protein